MTDSDDKATTNPVVFFDIALGGESLGRVKMELFADITPKTAENFRQYCTGENKNPQGRPQGYKGSKFHRVIREFMIQGGDFLNGDGTGSTCIYGTKAFADENFQLKHDTPGLLSMAVSIPHGTFGHKLTTDYAHASLEFRQRQQRLPILHYHRLLVPTPFLNNKHVVFGKVIDGMDVVHKVENTRVRGESKPATDVTIAQCGEM
ncbi:MAG: Peptidyl-prolyl cis-trans isomerase H [Alectoria sarmentosa]|nr:MAG: Peptidyl-prolyl cis-trans isomerase H [Alectoria sarmentosa]CAD6592790.1 MAG: Peptidyl-prolyl cis-trans isomerase H [Alectoria sarmentosa]